MSDNGGATGEAAPERRARRLTMSPGVVVAVLAVILIAAIAIGVIVNRPEGPPDVHVLTIAELRAAPDRYDNQSVRVQGTVEDVRELPYLSQYAIYTLRDGTGTMYVLTDRGAPPDEPIDQTFQLEAIYHSRVTLADELRRLVRDQLGSIAGEIVVRLLPGIPINVAFLEHRQYEPVGAIE